MPNVEVFLDSHMTEADVLELGHDHVMIATGAAWRRDGVGRANTKPIPGSDRGHVFAPEAVMRGEDIPDPVVIFDDDHYYLGFELAESLRRGGHSVSLVTPAADVANWTHLIYQQAHMQTRLLELGVKIVPHRNLVRIGKNRVTTACVFTGRRRPLAAQAVVMVTARLPERGLYDALSGNQAALAAAAIKSLRRIGDCHCPGIIAAAVFDGHAAAQALDAPPSPDVPFRRERIAIEASV
jgi:dimethylamine/trimethylamine dehydrogenase